MGDPPTPKIFRASGTTPSERYLAGLCEKSFLSLWSYPNLFIDKGGGQELCDLLVVFGDQVIIFSDKSCSFPESGDVNLDWARWYKRSIEKSADQVFGAERWLRMYPNRIFLDKACTRPFPLDLSKVQTFHRVVVALGAAERCAQHFGKTGSGSLMLMPLLLSMAPEKKIPFTIGDIAPQRGFVHVLDDVTLGIVMRELDTIKDFTEYLRAKEALIRGGRLLGAPGEEDLLASYLLKLGPNNEHQFMGANEQGVLIVEEGYWEHHRGSPRYAGKRELDKVSYVWDDLVETFNKNILAGTLEVETSLDLSHYERGVRIMAEEPRVARRLFGGEIVEKLTSVPQQGAHTGLMMTRQRPSVAYVFMLEPGPFDDETYEEYRTRRQTKLQAYCLVAKHLQPQLHHVVGIAREPAGAGGCSEDLVYLSATNWSAENEAQAKALHEKGLFRNVRKREGETKEFPLQRDFEPLDAQAARKHRNRRKRERKRKD